MIMPASSQKLTVRYSLYQTCYFVVNAGIVAFAASYLLAHSFTASQAGLILALTNIISCLIQPVIGDLADRMKGFVLPHLMAGLILLSTACFLAIQLFQPPLPVFGFLYVLGGLAESISVPLSNSLCALYTGNGFSLNYGIGAGVGSLAYSLASLAIGWIMALAGVDWMIRIAVLFLVIRLVLVLGYPKVSIDQTTKEEKSSLSFFAFLRRYHYYGLTLIGILFVGMCHSMCENYLINLFQAIGGDSSNVGTALFLACISAAPFLLLFERIIRKTSVRKLMRMSPFFYMAKALLLMGASQIIHVYAIELLQTVTYGFLYPSLYYFARESIAETDMVKGQAIIMAMYTLGLAFGSWAGGWAIDHLGLRNMFFLAFVLVSAGALLINLFIGKSEKKKK
jgi:PPP family 3-phenylpropionic acid transporter